MNAKTSISDPLEIQDVDIPELGGCIGMTICPGRKGASMAGGSWDRDLTIDLEVVRAWKPDMVIALLEDHEYANLGIPRFRLDVIEAGLPWVFTPIIDGGVPDAMFLKQWRALSPKIHAILLSGGRVLVHCRAGLGRTGMIVAMLLVELGDDPKSAIKRVRAARPNTIETQAQQSFVHQHAVD